jgi:hypothetical protein
MITIPKTKDIKIEDISKHSKYPYGIEATEVDEDDDYLDTTDVWWYETEQERDHEFKDLILE